MKRQSRPLVAILLTLLLVLMQQGAQLHALGHDYEHLQRRHDAGLQPPTVEVTCAMCALFAGGAHAAAADATRPPEPLVDISLPQRAPALVAVASRSPYQSRAPPSTL